MTLLDSFDYRRIDIRNGPPQMAFCWKHFAVLRAESLFRDLHVSIEFIKKEVKYSELWCGLVQTPQGYDHLILSPAWPNIDKAALGIQLIDQYFPTIASLTIEDWKNQQRRNTFTHIAVKTSAIPFLIIAEDLVERLFKKSPEPPHVDTTRHLYKETI